MDDYCGRFHLVKDMNNDGVFSITDVWQIIEFIWLLPAKAAIAIIQNNPKIATFLEIDCATGTSWGGGIFSFFAWCMLLGIIASIIEETIQQRK